MEAADLVVELVAVLVMVKVKEKSQSDCIHHTARKESSISSKIARLVQRIEKRASCASTLRNLKGPVEKSSDLGQRLLQPQRRSKTQNPRICLLSCFGENFAIKFVPTMGRTVTSSKMRLFVASLRLELT